MDAPEQSGPARRLRLILTRDSQGDTGREAARTVMSPEFERMALSPGWAPSARLACLTELASLTQQSVLPLREREVVVQELSRLALRILWWEGLLGPGMVEEAPADIAAAVLIEMVAAGLMPEGPAGWMALDRAKALLKRGDVVQSLKGNVPRRERLVQQLILAEARLKPLEI